jgi:hypothetical protein
MMEETMRDEFYDRDYQAGRTALHGGVDRLIAATMQTFRAIAAIQFDAPWNHTSARRVAGHR